MCDDILRGSSYGLDFSVMAKARVIVAAPCWSTSTIPAGCATVISARLTIPGRVGPVARHIGPQDHRVVDVTTEMHGRAARGPRRQGCNRRAVRGLRAVRRHTASTAGLPSVADPLPPAYPVLANCGSLPSGLASVDRDHATDRASARHPRQTPRNRRQPHGDRRGSRSHARGRHRRGPSGWRRRRCEQDRFTAPAGRRPRAPGRVNSCPQDLTGVAPPAMSNLSSLCTGRVHVQPSSRSLQVAGRRLRPCMVCAGR